MAVIAANAPLTNGLSKIVESTSACVFGGIGVLGMDATFRRSPN